MIGISDAKTAGLSPLNRGGDFGADLKATPIPVVSARALTLGMDNDNAEAAPNEAPAHDTVQENLFTTGSGKTVGAQRESNQIAELSPELVQAGTNMAKIVEEKEEAKKRTEDAVRDMVEAQQEAYWADREVECGGVIMTGAEWKAAAQYLGTAQGRKEAKKALDKAGVPKNEQDEYIRRAKDIYERMARGEKLTPEDDAFIKTNPTAWNELGKTMKAESQQSAEAKSEWSAAQRVSATTTAVKAGENAISAGADALDDAAPNMHKAASVEVEQISEAVDTGLTASVAPLKPTYNAAATANVPATTPAAAKPATQIAANSTAELQGMGIGV